MRSRLTLIGLAAAGMSISILAKDFPLQWTSLTPQEAALCPGTRPSATLTLSMPPSLRGQPKIPCGYPIYGVIEVHGVGLAFRLTESKGDGQGYDQLILDLNRNGDLRDDPVAAGPYPQRIESPYAEHSYFGPIQDPIYGKAGPWEVPLYLEVSVRNRSLWPRVRQNVPVLVGKAEWRPAGYLETTLDVEGVPERIGILDSNCNLQFGEQAAAFKSSGSRDGYSGFHLHDNFMRDRNRTGVFRFDALFSGTEFFSDVVCIGSNVCRLWLAPDLRSLSLEPYRGALGEVALSRYADKIKGVTLGWENSPGHWKPLTPNFINGKARVPAGSYCLYSCLMGANDSNGYWVLTGGHKAGTADRVIVAATGSSIISCGPPIQLRVDGRHLNLGRDRFSGLQEHSILIGVKVVGAAGEVYSAFLRANDPTARSAPPDFKVVNQRGQVVLCGQLQYG